MAENRLPRRERRKRYGRRVDVIECFRLASEIVRMDGNEFRSTTITVKRSKAVYFFANFGDLRIGCELFDDTENSWPGIEGVRGSPFAVW